MCNCVNELKQKMRNQIKTEVEVGTGVAEWVNEGLFSYAGLNLSGGPTKIGMPFEFSYIKRKKNGDPERRTTNGHVYVYGSYCPFCGEKYPEQR